MRRQYVQSSEERDEARAAEAFAPRLMTPADAARYMGLAEGTVRRMIAAGRLPIVRIGRATRIDRIKLDKLLDGGVLSTGD
jgi:excisionase family DNA binding protein